MNMQRSDQLLPAPSDRSLLPPCLLSTGTSFFAPTADQRFLVGEKAFLRTHFPIQLYQRRADHTTLITENALLHQLASPSPDVVGNRVFILYGAAGSGKSELLRWLQTQLQHRHPDRFAVTTRIARTELDIGHIAQRFQRFYHQQPLQQATLQRWEEIRQKPRTVAKILALTALEQLLSSDEQVNALYYQLIDVIQTNLEHYFMAMKEPVEGHVQLIELLSREDIAELLRESAVPLSLEYETLRHTLLKTFRDLLLEGLDLPIMLKNIAHHVQQSSGQRPILLIDDLVQSIHLFATDLLDYFITLEEGCWDVVIGMTPSSLDATARGKELLARLAYLDTIDDRVQKLWLSDEYGLSSSFLDETNCVEYARLYLNEYKRHNHYHCDNSCPAFYRCQTLEPMRNDTLLTPFNKELIIRLFRSLPPHKGKVRYFTLALQDILQRIAQGEQMFMVLRDHVKAELAVYHTNPHIAQCYEFYGPFTEEAQADASASTNLLAFFALHPLNGERPVIIPLSKRRHRQEPNMSEESAVGESSDFDAGKEAIKHWLQGEAVNKQQLRNLRRGIVKTIKDGYAIDTMTPLYNAKSTHILRWTQTRFDTVPPVALENVDDFDGLPIQRTLGPLSYLLHDFADATGWTEQQLRSEILTNAGFPLLLFQAMAYRQQQLCTLEEQLGMSVEELACVLLRLATLLSGCPLELPFALQQHITVETQLPLKYPERLEAERPHLTTSQVTIIRRLCEDCFKLRENVFNGDRLRALLEKYTPKHALDVLLQLDVTTLAADFRIHEEQLSHFLRGIQEKLQVLTRLRTDERVKHVLSSLCRHELDSNGTMTLRAMMVHGANDTTVNVADFLQDCHLYELHQVLCQGAVIETVRYERSMVQLQQMLMILENGQHTVVGETTHALRHFTRAEVEIFTRFVQKGHRLPLTELDTVLLTKTARYLPELYRQLELCFQGS